MKRSIPCLLAAAMISASSLIAGEAIAKIDSAVTIDGNLDDPCWKDIAPVRADYIKSKKGVLNGAPQLTVKYAWDEHYLYIAYEAFDANIVAAAKPGSKGPEKNTRPLCENWKKDEKVDVVEFFISFGDEHFFWELHHNGANQFNDIFCIVPDSSWHIADAALTGPGIIFNTHEFIQDDGPYTVAMAVQMKPRADGKPSTVNDPSDVDTGYTAEIRLPWRGIGAPSSCAPIESKRNPDTAWRMTGQKVKILAVVQNGDLEEKYYHSSAKGIPSWFHKSASRWPEYTLKAGANSK